VTDAGRHDARADVIDPNARQTLAGAIAPLPDRALFGAARLS
jgi:hypothetical protein